MLSMVFKYGKCLCHSNQKQNIYHALFYSHVIYGVQVWETHIKAIQILQNRVVRLITYNDHFPLIPSPLPASNPIFCKLELLKNKRTIHIYGLYFYIYKCLNTSLSLFEGWFKPSSSIHEHKTR